MYFTVSKIETNLRDTLSLSLSLSPLPKWKRGKYRKNGARNFPRRKAKNMQILERGKSLLHCPWQRSAAKVYSAALVSFLYCTLLHSAEKASCLSVDTENILLIYQIVNILYSNTYVFSPSPSMNDSQEGLCFTF